MERKLRGPARESRPPEKRPQCRRTETRNRRNSHAASSRVRIPPVARQLRQFLYREWRGASARLQRSERSHCTQHARGIVPDSRSGANILRRSDLGIRGAALYDAATTDEIIQDRYWCAGDLSRLTGEGAGRSTVLIPRPR